MSKTVLVVDDEPEILKSVRGNLMDDGYEVLEALDGPEALKKVDEDTPDLVLLDIKMPGMNGIEVLELLKQGHPQLPVVMMSAHGTIETAVKATKLGAYDFIEKPLSLERLTVVVQKAMDYRQLEEETLFLRRKEEARYQLTGHSECLNELRRQIEIVAPTSAWILIRGENGTGKEIVAHTIHRLSKRRNKPFVEVNCAAIPEDLIESELFGHEKGAFTGATAQRKGKFDLAHGGTLFLDEIGDMSLKTQAKILRILQEQKFERVGGGKTITVDVRVLAATNKDLEYEISQGNFREDLYYRINVVPLEVPSLRDRKEDLPELVEDFLKEYAYKTNTEKKSLTPVVLETFREYDWPGNIRELKNLIERLVIMTPGSDIETKHLPAHLLKKTETEAFPCVDPDFLKETDFRTARGQFEKEFIIRKLQEFGGNIAYTAEALGLERSHLHKKIKAYGIKAEHGD
ncbi:MAG: sigma-54-dependent Fis family transcriptional regulator [Deltaproteobacteria bacterium]|nr:sigma-54-dependent Fis family transcriptional regulator [Deltaproteobacteria bacterium]